MTAATYLNYSASAWLGRATATRRVARRSSPRWATGGWPALRPTRCRPRPAPAAGRRPRARTADDVEALRNADGGFDIEVVARPLRRGQRALPRPGQGPAHRHRDRRRRAHRRREGVRRRDPHVRPRRRPPAVGVGHRRARPRPRVARVGTPGEGRVMTARRSVRARCPAPSSTTTGLRHLGNPLGEQRALAAGRGDRAPRRPRGARRAGRGPAVAGSIR